LVLKQLLISEFSIISIMANAKETMAFLRQIKKKSGIYMVFATKAWKF